MARKKKNGKNSDKSKDRRVSLKELAAHLDLSTTSLSFVLNDAPAASAIPQETKDRIFEAAREFNYRPNYIARSLRAQRTHTIGVLIPELSGGYSSMVLSGVEEKLLEEDFYYFVGSHRHKEEYIERYSRFFIERCVEGILAIDTPQSKNTFLPVVSISGHEKKAGVTNIILDHEKAARFAIRHLTKLGHKKIAVIKGQEFSSDTEIRCHSIVETAANFGIPIRENLIVQLIGDDPSPEPGYVAARKLISRKADFTALVAFNDISAIGAIHALREAGYEVPGDVSVIGFDDVYEARFHNPALTTICQPLKEMGRLGAENLLKRIRANPKDEFPSEISVEPELKIRQSTAQVKI